MNICGQATRTAAENECSSRISRQARQLFPKRAAKVANELLLNWGGVDRP